jgi:hypothetical protein
MNYLDLNVTPQEEVYLKITIGKPESSRDKNLSKSSFIFAQITEKLRVNFTFSRKNSIR